MSDIRAVDFTKSDLIKIVVGNVSYFAHIGILTKSSLFLQNALKGSFKEANDKRIDLQDVKPDIFLIYLQWLHGGDLAELAVGNDHDDRDDRDYVYDPESDEPTTYAKLFDLAILADQMQDCRLHNQAVDCILHRASTTDDIVCNMAHHVYTNTLDSSPLRPLVVYFALLATLGQDEEMYFQESCFDYDAGPIAFWKDLAKQLAKVNGQSYDVMRSKRGKSRLYHLHNDEDMESECKSCKRKTVQSPQTSTALVISAKRRRTRTSVQYY